MQYNEGEKVSRGGAVSREAVHALGEDGVEVAPLLGQKQQAWRAKSSSVGRGRAVLPGQLVLPVLETVLPREGLPAPKRKLELPASGESIQLAC